MALQERDSVAGIVGNECVPPGDCEGTWITPGIIIDGVEVAALIIGAAVQILGQKLLVCGNICCGISGKDLAIVPIADILLHVPNYCFYVWGTVGIAGIVDDFVSGKECHSV